jgi:small subunit ribosomal protein S7
MRRSKPEPRAIQPDPKFSSELVARFVNKIMREGKKTKAYKIFYTALDVIARKTQQNPLDVFQAAVNNAMPLLEVRPRRVGRCHAASTRGAHAASAPLARYAVDH